MIAALRLSEPSWHRRPAAAGGDDGGGRESFDGRVGGATPGDGGGGGPVRIGSEREELYKMYSDHIEVRIGCLSSAWASAVATWVSTLRFFIGSERQGLHTCIRPHEATGDAGSCAMVLAILRHEGLTAPWISSVGSTRTES